MNATWTGPLLVGMGVLIMMGSALNWGIVTRPEKLFNRIFCDTVARILHFVVGVCLFVVAIGRMIGANWL